MLCRRVQCTHVQLFCFRNSTTIFFTTTILAYAPGTLGVGGAGTGAGGGGGYYGGAGFFLLLFFSFFLLFINYSVYFADCEQGRDRRHAVEEVDRATPLMQMLSTLLALMLATDMPLFRLT